MGYLSKFLNFSRKQMKLIQLIIVEKTISVDRNLGNSIFCRYFSGYFKIKQDRPEEFVIGAIACFPSSILDYEVIFSFAGSFQKSSQLLSIGTSLSFELLQIQKNVYIRKNQRFNKIVYTLHFKIRDNAFENSI